jgi:hypothetical protein
MLAIIVCAFLLVAVAYFAVLCGTEAIWWLRDRRNTSRPASQQRTTLSHRQVVTR